MIDVSQSYRRIVVETKAGLTGTSTVAHFECIFDEKTFYVWLGDTPISYFDKCTYMNLLDIAEGQGATEVVLVLDRQHTEKRAYERSFKVIDAVKIKSTQLPIRESFSPQGYNFFKVAL